jgi:SAM-dependent methyltransferase
VKAAVLRLAALVPGAGALDRLAKARLAGTARTRLDLHLTPALKMLARLRDLRGFAPADRAVLEIGAGWNPVVGVLFSLLGARRVVLLDVRRFLTRAGVRDVLDQMTAALPGIAEATTTDADALSARLRAMAAAESPAGALAAGGIEYLAPARAEATGLPDGSIDLVYSTCVLEHVPAADLPEQFRETARILAPGGLAYHIVDFSDHFAHGDPSLPRLNFLRYGDRTWRWIGQHRLFHLNRLRAPEVERLATGAGLRIVHVERQVHPEDVTFVQSLDLPDRFRGMAAADVAIHLVHLLVEKPRG